MITTRRKSPRFHTGQTVRITPKAFYPNPHSKQRLGTIEEIHQRGTAYSVRIPGHPRILYYSVRELRRSAA